jgi:hypothetical protein
VRLAAGVVVCVVCWLGGGGGPAHADRAEQLFKKGKKLLAEKKYPEACTAFEDSDRIDPGIGAKLNVAKCYQEWGKLATAWKWFSDAEQMAKDTKDDRARKIHGLAEELDASVPRLTVKAPRNASTTGIEIKLDGVAFEISALGTERRVDPGPHQIDYVIDGARKTKTIPVERGGSSEVTLEIPEKLRGAVVREPSASAGVDDPGRTRRIVGIGASVVGIVVVGTAAVVTWRARDSYKNALTAHCRGATDMCDADGLTATHAARHRANIATIVTIGGAAAVAGGLFLYLTAPGAGSRGTEFALYLAPSIGGDGNGVVLGGAF